MARTRLRGLEIAGVQIGIELPPIHGWEWPSGVVAGYRCLPRDPEVHVGVRVSPLADGDLGGERYQLGSQVFEVERRARGWTLGLSQGGRRSLLASFDPEFRAGEVTLSPEAARRSLYPLRSPLDEWIVLHRVVARGGLCLNGIAERIGGAVRIRLGALAEGAGIGGALDAAGSRVVGEGALILCSEGGVLRSFRTPWGGRSAGDAAGRRAPVLEIAVREESLRPFREVVDREEAAELIVAHALAPVCDETLLHRVLANAQRIAEHVQVVRIGETTAESAPIAWRSPGVQGAWAPPRPLL